MSWLRIDDGLATNPKMLAVSAPASRYLYVVGLTYCARELTDGLIPDGAVGLVVAAAGSSKRSPQDLVAAGLWVRVDGGFQVPDYLEFNPSREQVLAERAKGAERQRRSRESRKVSRRDNGATDGGGDGVSPPDPYPCPNPTDVSRSVAAADPVPAGPLPLPQGDPGVAFEACEILADRRLAKRMAVATVNDPGAYRAAALAGIRQDHLAGFRMALGDAPDLTADQLASTIEPPAPPPRPTPSGCSSCDDSGYVWSDPNHDAASPCPDCPIGRDLADRHFPAEVA